MCNCQGVGDGVSRTVVRDSDGQDLNLDAISGALPVIQTLHKELHEGELQRGYHYFGSIANGGVAKLYIKTSLTQSIHLRLHADLAGDFLFEIIEAPTVTAVGTPVNVYNMNRITGDGGFNGEMRFTPTVTAATGTTFYTEHVAGGSGGQAVGTEQEAFEQILKANTEYVVQITNNSGQSQLVGIGGTLYEYPED